MEDELGICHCTVKEYTVKLVFETEDRFVIVLGKIHWEAAIWNRKANNFMTMSSFLSLTSGCQRSLLEGTLVVSIERNKLYSRDDMRRSQDWSFP